MNTYNELNIMKKIVVGVDIGGSHVSAQLIDMADRTGIQDSWVRNKLDSNGKAEAIIETWATTIEGAMRHFPVRPGRINVAIPGPIDYMTGICMIKGQGKYENLYGLNVKTMLAERLSFSPDNICLVNDAACFLQGELFSGSLMGISEAIGITLGTGLGTSYASKGMVRDADLWQMPFGDGIAEDYISTRWFIKRFKELSGIRVDDVQDLVENYHPSRFFRHVFLEFSANLGEFLYRFIKLKNPDAAVLGGNIVNAGGFFLDGTRSYLSAKLGYDFPLETSVLGERAMTMGAGASS